MLTVKEAATLLNVSQSFVRRLIAKYELPHSRFGSAIRLQPADLLAYRDGCRIEADVAWQAAKVGATDSNQKNRTKRLVEFR